MYGLYHRLNSAKHLRALLTAAAAAYPKRSLLLTPPLRPFGSRQVSRRPPNPAGVDDFVKKAKGGYKNEYKRKVLPKKLLSKNVVKLTCESTAPGGICDVYLVGTTHLSGESWREVRDVIKFLQPQVVFLELCSSRTSILSRKDAKDALGRGELVYGAEFFVANEEARKYGGKVILGDRPIDITEQRAWAKMPFFLNDGFFSPSSNSEIAKMLKEMNAKAESRLPELHSKFPALVKIYIHERDQYMSAKLLEVARKSNSVVAVVGKGHLPGMQKNWKQPVDMEELLRVPTGISSFITPKLVAVVVIIGGIYLLFMI